MTLEHYLQAPCKMLSIPFWKAQTFSLPADMKIVHDGVFHKSDYPGFRDEQYFRLSHSMKYIGQAHFDGFEILSAASDAIPIVVDIVNKSYSDIQASTVQFENYTKTPVYRSDLWILVKDLASGTYAGCGIADFDDRAKELILEWIQVLPEYRRKGIGTLIVNALLNRGKAIADFATVSGKTDNAAKPESLYRRCGFTGNDIWHILTRNPSEKENTEFK